MVYLGLASCWPSDLVQLVAPLTPQEEDHLFKKYITENTPILYK